MINKGTTLAFLGLALFSITFAVAAQNKVVVIPLFGDDTKPIANVLVVAKQNGDFTSPVAALNSITDASKSNPYLVAIAPGEYQLGSAQIVLKPYVELVGSGRIVTRLIASRGSATDDASAAVIAAADNSSISNLSIENTRANTSSFGIYSEDAKVTIKNVSITMDNGPASGFHVGILNDTSEVEISHVDIDLSDGGQQIGIFSRNNSKVKIDHSTVESSAGSSFQYGILGSNSETIVNHTKLNVTGGASRQWGYSAGGTASGGTPHLELNHVAISLSDGVSNDQLGLELAIQGASNTTVIRNSNIIVDAGSAAFAAGISLLQAGHLEMSNTEIATSGASGASRGVTQNIGTTSTIRASRIFGADSSIFLGGPSTPALAYVSDSFLEGGTNVGSGNFRCSFVFNGFGSQLDSNCASGP